MEFSEIVGVVILVLALLLPLAKRALERRAKAKDPDAYRRAQEEVQAQREARLLQLQQAMGYRVVEPEVIEEEEEVVMPQPEPVKEPLITRPAQAVVSSTRSRVRQLLNRLDHPRDMVVLHEILSEPVALRQVEK